MPRYSAVPHYAFWLFHWFSVTSQVGVSAGPQSLSEPWWKVQSMWRTWSWRFCPACLSHAWAEYLDGSNMLSLLLRSKFHIWTVLQPLVSTQRPGVRSPACRCLFLHWQCSELSFPVTHTEGRGMKAMRGLIHSIDRGSECACAVVLFMT